jgi:hypothetical protein
MTKKGYVVLIAAAIVIVLALAFRGHGHRFLSGIAPAIHGR